MPKSKPEFPAVPTLEMIRAHEKGILAIIEFLEWCEDGEEAGFESRVFLTREDPMGEIMESHEHMAWRFYGIDHKKVEEERCALLDHQRALNDWNES